VKLRINSRILGTALRVVTVLVIVALVYLGYTVWSSQQRVTQGTVASRAIDNLVKEVEKNPNNPQARVLLAQALAAAGRVDQAVEQLNYALEIDANSVGALETLGLIAMQRGEWATAEGYWRRIVEIVGKSPMASQDQRMERANHYLGLVLIERNEYEEAVLYLKEALRIRRDASDTHYALAVAYRELGSVSNQRKELETALAFDPLLPEANYDMALLLLADGDRAGAAELLRRSVDNAKGRAEPAAELEKLGPFEDRLAAAERLSASDAQAALVEARIAIAIVPKDLAAARLVARLLEDLDKKDDAVLAWERVKALAPNDPEATDALKRLGQ
jgi:Flp pilus assembly protein TadD